MARKAPPTAERRSLKRANSMNWDWDAVTEELCDWISDGKTRSKFAARKDTPDLSQIRKNIGMNEDRSARVNAAYRFRSEACADSIMDLRERMLDEHEDVDTAAARAVLTSLHREIENMTSIATRPAQAKTPINAASQADMASKIEAANERNERDGG